MKKKKAIKGLGLMVLFIVVLWFILALFNLYRVNKDKRPVLCFNYVKADEDEDEYNLTCKGILYKYREYYLIKDDSMTAREYTLFFKEFTRTND